MKASTLRTAVETQTSSTKLYSTAVKTVETFLNIECCRVHIYVLFKTTNSINIHILYNVFYQQELYSNDATTKVHAKFKQLYHFGTSFEHSCARYKFNSNFVYLDFGHSCMNGYHLNNEVFLKGATCTLVDLLARHVFMLRPM